MKVEACPQCGTEALPIGIEIPEHYDGVLTWHCKMCAFCWPRFSMVDNERLYQVGTEFATDQNERTRALWTKGGST